MKHHARTAGVLLVGLTSVIGLGVVDVHGHDEAAAHASTQAAASFADARLKIEYNATDGDAGLQIFIDAEPWRNIRITNPQGRKVVQVVAKDVIRRFGLTELFSESSEPPFDEFPFEEFKKLFPEGRYTFEGTTIAGETMRSVVRFTHRVPGEPNIVSPGDDAVLPRDGLVVSWEPVRSPRGITIAAYQVLVVADAPARGNPTRVLDVMLPASATGLPIPAEFLLPGAYKTEVLAIEMGGNQTLSEVAFRIRP